MEVIWVLQKVYKRDRKNIAGAIAALVYLEEFFVEESDAVHRSLWAFDGSSADFSDCLIAQLGQRAGCEHTFTFDREAAKLPGMKLLV